MGDKALNALAQSSAVADSPRVSPAVERLPTPVAPAPKRNARPRRGPITLLLDLFSSVWWGVSLLVVAVVYMSVGSAMPEVRQHFELTELAWFQTPAFNALLALFVVSVITVTLRRIPFNIYKAGVWTTHLGLVLLAVGCALYFGLKVEGLVKIPRRAVEIRLPGAQPTRLPAIPGLTPIRVAAADGVWAFQVFEVDPAYRPLNDDVKAALAAGGKETAFRVVTRVVRPDGRAYFRTDLDGFPEQSQDHDDAGRAKTQLGRLRFDEPLQTLLTLCPVTQFQLRDSAAIYARVTQANAPPAGMLSPVGGEGWKTLSLTSRLPYYNEHYDPAWDVLDPEAAPRNRGPLDIPLPSPVPGLQARVTGYLPYVTLAEAYVDARFDPPGAAGDPANSTPFAEAPTAVADLTAQVGEARPERLRLVADLPSQAKATVGGVAVRLTRASTPEELDALKRRALTQLTVIADVGPDKVVADVPLSVLTIEGGVVVRGTPYRLQLVGLASPAVTQEKMGLAGARAAFRVTRDPGNLPPDHPHRGLVTPLAFTRVLVAGTPVEADRLQDGTLLQGPADAGLHLSLPPPEPSWTLVCMTGELAGQPPALIQRDPMGEVSTVTISPGEPLSLRCWEEVATVRVALRQQARSVPAEVVPLPLRQPLRDVQRQRSLVRVELSTEHWRTALWLAHREDLNLASEADLAKVSVPGVGEVSLLYSQERLPLSQPIALADFEIPKGVGGQVNRDFVSHLALTSPDGQAVTGPELTTRLNDPYWEGAYHLFQAFYDGQGQSWTGLLVANRHGMLTMSVGIALMLLGTTWAFYVKPVLQRRAVRQALAAKGLAESDLALLRAKARG